MPSLTHLPLFYRFNRINQHDDVKNKTVPNPNKQNYLHHHKENQRKPKSELISKPETDGEAQNIAERIDNRIAKVIERNRAPRVQIAYDVETYGSPTTIELPRVQELLNGQAPSEELFERARRVRGALSSDDAGAGTRLCRLPNGRPLAIELKLDAEVLGKLDELFPPPGPNGAKPAPEAYAW